MGNPGLHDDCPTKSYLSWSQATPAFDIEQPAVPDPAHPGRHAGEKVGPGMQRPGRRDCVSHDNRAEVIDEHIVVDTTALDVNPGADPLDADQPIRCELPITADLAPGQKSTGVDTDPLPERSEILTREVARGLAAEPATHLSAQIAARRVLDQDKCRRATTIKAKDG